MKKKGTRGWEGCRKLAGIGMEAGDSLMKADTGRILRQRFCFRMAMVSCRSGEEGWGQAASPRSLPWSLLLLFRAPSRLPALAWLSYWDEERGEAGLGRVGEMRPGPGTGDSAIQRNGGGQCFGGSSFKVGSGGALTMLVPSSSSVVSSWSWFRPRPREDRSCPWPGPDGGSDSVFSWARCRA